MKELFHNFLCNVNPFFALALLILCGVIIGLFLSPLLATLTKRTPSGNFPKDVAMHFKDNFKHGWPSSVFYPGTHSIVHDLTKLKNYILDVEKTVYDRRKPDVQAEIEKGNQPGMAFYFGKSYSKHYLQDTGTIIEGVKVYRCVPRKEYTIFLHPVWYKEGFTDLDAKDCMPPRTNQIGPKKKLEDPVRVFDLAYASNPFEETEFNKRARELLCRKDDEAFDLGHTNP